MLVTVLLSLFWLSAGPLAAPASAGASDKVNFTLEGCRLPAGATLPDTNGDFICDDSQYGPGNQGKNYSELDLVPFRLTADTGGSNSPVYDIVVAADRTVKDIPGFDVISVPKVNARLSTLGGVACTVLVGPEQTTDAGATIYRKLTITQTPGTKCVLDYYQRLAIGSSQIRGSSLHSFLLNGELSTAGVGTRSVPIPVGAAQQLSKTMTATRGAKYLWTVNKSATPAVDLGNSCLPAAATGKDVAVSVSWTRSEAQPDGTTALVTTITATNPSSRKIDVDIASDTIYAGATAAGTPLVTKTDFETKEAGPNGGKAVWTFTTVVASAETQFTDVAKASYIDKVTNVPVQDTTSATATATAITSDDVASSTATLTDVESITGPYSFAVKSVSGAPGTFSPAYTVGSGEKVKNLSWTSGTLSGSGSVTFTKSITADRATVTSGTLSDVATLTPAGSAAQTATAKTAITASATLPTVQFEKTVTIAPLRDTTFSFEIFEGDKRVLTVPVTVKAGETTAKSGAITLAVSATGYTWVEEFVTGYNSGVETGVRGTIGPLDYCDTKTVNVNNLRDTGRIKIEKVVNGAVKGETIPAFKVDVDCDDNRYDQTGIQVRPGTASYTGNIPTGTTCQVTEQQPLPTGYSFVAIDPVDPADATKTRARVSVGLGDTVTVTITNKRNVGHLVIVKKVSGPLAGSSGSFSILVDCGSSGSFTVPLTVKGDNGTATGTTPDVPTGTTCSISESPDSALWSVSIDKTEVTVTDQTPVVTVTVTNTRKIGKVTITKTTQGDPTGAGTTFVISLDCDVDAYDRKNATFTMGQSISYDVPTGVKCTVTEPDDGVGWTKLSITPSGEFTVGSTEVEVAVVNSRDLGRITVTKTIEGDPTGSTLQQFTFVVNCVGTEYDETITMTLAELSSGSLSKTTGPIPTLLECTVTETNANTGGWKLQSVTGGDNTVANGVSVAVPSTVSFTNARGTGGLVVIKNAQNRPVDETPTFVVDIDCTGTAYDHENAKLVAAGGYRLAYNGIPTGVICAVTEDGVPSGWKQIAPLGTQTVTIGDGTVVTVTVTNERIPGGFTIVKRINGSLPGDAPTFRVDVDCAGTGAAATAYDHVGDKAIVLSAANQYTALVDGIPVGRTCSISEQTPPAGFARVSIDKPSIVVGSDTSTTVMVTNVRQRADLMVRKTAGDANLAGAVFDLYRDNGDDSGHGDSDDSGDVDHGDNGDDSDSGDGDGQFNAATDTVVTSCTTADAGVCTVRVDWGSGDGTSYFWYERTAPAGYNLPTQQWQGPITVTAANVTTKFATTTFNDTRTGVTTTPSSGPVVINPQPGTNNSVKTVFDFATLTGLSRDATGTVTFQLFGPFASGAAVTCNTTPVFTSSGNPISLVSETGAFVAMSGVYTPSSAGLYQWRAIYTGDAKNVGITGTCPDVTEQTTVRAGPGPQVAKVADPATGSVVQPDGSIAYTVTVSNVGDAPIVNGPVVDTLPIGVTAVAGSISSGGVLSADGRTITWSVNLAARGAEGASKELTYRVTVNSDAPRGADLGNRVVFFDQQATTTHRTPTGDLTIVKTNNPTGGVAYGGSITYTMKVTASGTLTQAGVSVSDYIPGYKPGDTTSLKTSLTANSAVCDAGTCTVGYDAATRQLTWQLGAIAGGSARTVAFTVTVDRPAAAADGSIAVGDVRNAALVGSTQTPPTPSNQVVNPVAQVTQVLPPPTPPTQVVNPVAQVPPPPTQVVNPVAQVPPPPTGALTIVKANDPTTSVAYGGSITYTLLVGATGTLNQTGVVVTDVISGYDPADPTSLSTTYTIGSGRCGGTCTVAYDAATRELTWQLGTMAGGSTRVVSFTVTVDRPTAAADGSISSGEVRNAALVQSTQTAPTRSNQVINPVTAVLGVKVSNQPPAAQPPAARPPAVQPVTLPRTGPFAPIDGLLWWAAMMITVGLGLTVASTRARRRAQHRC